MLYIYIYIQQKQQQKRNKIRASFISNHNYILQNASEQKKTAKKQRQQQNCILF